MAMPLYVNLALLNTERIVREVQVALRRFDAERALAMRSVERVLGSQLRGNLTGILLNSDLALRQKSISPRRGGECQVRARSGREDAISAGKGLIRTPRPAMVPRWVPTIESLGLGKALYQARL